jgi:hypothetical protein
LIKQARHARTHHQSFAYSCTVWMILGRGGPRGSDHTNVLHRTFPVAGDTARPQHATTCPAQTGTLQPYVQTTSVQHRINPSQTKNQPRSLLFNSEFCHTHTHTRRIYQYKTGSLRLGEYKTLDNYCLFIYLLAHLVMDRQLLSTQQEEAVILVHNPCYSTIPYSLIRRI